MEPFVHDAVLDMQMARAELLSALGDIGPGDWGRFVPYGSRTLHDLLAHVAGADQAWALAAQGLLRGEGDVAPPLAPAEAKAARERAIERGRSRTPAELIEEMEQRRKLLLGLLRPAGATPPRAGVCGRTATRTTPSASASGSAITIVCTPPTCGARCV